LIRTTALALWAAIAGVLTLTTSAQSASAFATCVFCGDMGTSGFLLNIGLFVPLGMLLASYSRSARWALVAGAGISVLIEVLQLVFVGGRTVSPGDVLANGSGALIGALLMINAKTLIAPTPVQRRRLVLGWSALLLAFLIAGWWTSRPWLPEGVWYLQRAPSRVWADDYQGTLHVAGIGSTNLASDAIRDGALVHAVRSGEADFTVLESPGAAPERLSYIARLVEGRSGLAMATFARRGNALVIGRNSNAARARLSTLGSVIPDAYHGVRNDSVLLRMNLASGAVSLASRTGPQKFAVPAPSPLRAWSWFWPTHRDLTGTQRLVADVAWAVLLLLPLAWWWRPTRSATSPVSTPASDRAHR